MRSRGRRRGRIFVIRPSHFLHSNHIRTLLNDLLHHHIHSFVIMWLKVPKIVGHHSNGTDVSLIKSAEVQLRYIQSSICIVQILRRFGAWDLSVINDRAEFGVWSHDRDSVTLRGRSVIMSENNLCKRHFIEFGKVNWGGNRFETTTSINRDQFLGTEACQPLLCARNR